ncbi:MAG: YcaQ family DNA glycosylase [Chloroflexi bacterium]|nr:YcaQ family DNA glycosylase [Chloroflexota bacterium]
MTEHTHTLFSLTPTHARRLAITRQHLAHARHGADAEGILNLVRDLGCIQIDPISAVARSHLLVLWSRLGNFDSAHLDALMWQERKLFEYWAHCASIVLTEDYPIHGARMRGYAKGDSPWSERVRAWTKQNDVMRRRILAQIRRHGAMLSRDLGESGDASRAWVSTGWTSGRTVSRMLDFLWMQGTLMVVGREGIQKKWGLSKTFLPEWTPRERWSAREIVRAAAQKSLRALGVATPRQIQQHFIRGRYPNLNRVLAELENEKRILRVQVADWQGEWYLHADDVPLLEKIKADEWQPHTTLLSPFDNLICDRARTKLFFDFDYTMEIYTPAAKRKFGYYVLPILHGDRLIGRIDSTMDRANARYHINAVYAEPNAPANAARAIANAIEALSAFLGAEDITYTRRVPKIWKARLL